jgi:DNA-binding SARP family transcriptional activator
LIRLALDAGRTVGIESLTEAVWAADPPSGAANALQTLVSRLRRGLPTDTVTANQIGYQVTATVDVDEFDSLVRDARAAVARGDFADARVRYDAALARWRGAPLADVATADFARAPIARLTEGRAAAAEERLAVRLALGETATAVAELEELVAAQPLRERPHQLLIAALGSAGRAADAVAVYVRLRDRLAEELGIDPSAQLTATYAAMLRGERASFGPALFAPDLFAPAVLGLEPGSTASAAMPSVGPGPRPKGNLRPAFTSFVGRESDIGDLVTAVGAHRLVTLVGPGGAGKTRLAVEVGRAVGDEFRDEVLESGQVLVDGGVLTGQPDHRPHLVRVLHDVVTADRGVAGIRSQQSGKHANDRRVARAVRPEKAEHRPRLHGQVDAVHRGRLAEAFDQTLGLDRICHGTNGGRRR